MDLKQLEDAIRAAGTSPAETKTEAEVKPQETKETQVETEVDVDNSIKAELEKVKQKSTPKSEEEKAEYTFKSIAKRLQDLGKDPAELLGIKKEEEIEDEEDKPLTKKDLEVILKQVNKAPQKTALELAQEIQNESERELTVYYLENVIKSTGNHQEDLSNAKTMVEAIKLKKQIELQKLRPEVKTHSSASSVTPNTSPNQNVELTKEEDYLIRASGGLLTKEDILKSRQPRK